MDADADTDGLKDIETLGDAEIEIDGVAETDTEGESEALGNSPSVTFQRSVRRTISSGDDGVAEEDKDGL